MECVAAVQEGFYSIASFPGVIGAVDGTHIRIQVPCDYKEQYVSRKNYQKSSKRCSVEVQHCS